MEAIRKDQIKAIYALGTSLGIVVRGSKDDDLHQLISGMTGKSNVSNLDEDEAVKVLQELTFRMRLCNQKAPLKAKRHAETPGGLSCEQQKKVWAMMYELQSYDERPSPVSLGERLAGIIRKEMNIDATARNPFAWLNCIDGNALIDKKLKNYLRNAKKKAQARSGTG